MKKKERESMILWKLTPDDAEYVKLNKLKVTLGKEYPIRDSDILRYRNIFYSIICDEGGWAIFSSGCFITKEEFRKKKIERVLKYE